MTTTYNVYRNGSLIASGLTSPAYVDTGLTDGTLYTYQVSATVNGVEGQKSTTASATPQVANPVPVPTPTPTGSPPTVLTTTPHAPIVVTTNNQTISGESFSAGSGYGIYAVGSAGSHITNLTISQCSFSGFASAIWAGFVDNILVEDCIVDGCSYSGIMVLSAVNGSVVRNRVSNILVGGVVGVDNAYGIAISQQNPATDPQSTGVLVTDNIVDNVPTWHGLDTHAGIGIQFRRNKVTRCRHGIFVTTDSSGRRNSGVITDSNSFTAPAGADQYGVVYVYSTNGVITGNAITGWPSGHGILLSNSGDPTADPINLTQSGNVISP